MLDGDESRLVRIGTRGSALARWQTNFVRDLLIAAHPELKVEIVVFVTQGDRILDKPLPQIGGKGLFTVELEQALRDRAIDLAVHSLKDLPTEDPPGLTIGATPERADPRDVLISRAGHTLATLPEGSGVGTSSLRRAAQLRRLRPDLQMIDIRGNIDTRIRKALDASGPYDAILLAAAGVERLNQIGVVSEYLTAVDVLPAPGQAALAIQCRDEPEMIQLLAPIDHEETSICVTAERAFLRGLGGGCSVPVAALGTIKSARLHLVGRVSRVDGGMQVDVSIDGVADRALADDIGQELACLALSRGAGKLLGSQP